MALNTDFFLAHPPLQPKSEIADYVAACGIAVPQRFSSFDEALANGQSFLMRSEHPQEYAGSAGLLQSPTADSTEFDDIQKYHVGNPKSELYIVKNAIAMRAERKITDQELVQQLNLQSQQSIHLHCKLLGLSPQEFTQNILYSYWKKLRGWNLSIVRDNAIANRHHIFVNNTDDRGRGYLRTEKGRIDCDVSFGIADGALLASAAHFVQFYESVRQLKRFDPNHCPMIECQFVNDALYFLQYHRVRDFSPATFELTRECEAGELATHFVRGATAPEGFQGTAVFHSPFDLPALAPEFEEAAFDATISRVFKEIMSRRRSIQIIDKDDSELLLEATIQHLGRSALFNPQVSIAANFSHVFTREFWDRSRAQQKESGKPITIPVRVISDGRKSFVKLLTT